MPKQAQLSVRFLGISGLLVLLVYLTHVTVPSVKLFLPVEYQISEEEWPARGVNNLHKYDGPLPTPCPLGNVSYHVGPLNYMIIVMMEDNITPSPVNSAIFSAWIAENRQWVDAVLPIYGGVLWRRFGLSAASDFDSFAVAIYPNITSEEYLGTSPRTRVSGTRYISTASEIPFYQCLPEHQEMSFLPSPPHRIYFFAAKPNTGKGGETPLTNFRAVAASLPSDVKNRLQSLQMKYTRRYFSHATSNLNPLKTKAWQAMFHTDNVQEALSKATSSGMHASYDEKSADITLVNKGPVFRQHPITAEEFWSNHFAVLHGPTYTYPYAWAAQLQESYTTLALFYFLHLWVQGGRWLGIDYGHNIEFFSPDDNITFPIPHEDAVMFRKLLLKHTWMYTHEAGDVVALDNSYIAHGRQPWYEGGQAGRSILTFWH